jgi:hypothetical protein
MSARPLATHVSNQFALFTHPYHPIEPKLRAIGRDAAFPILILTRERLDILWRLASHEFVKAQFGKNSEHFCCVLAIDRQKIQTSSPYDEPVGRRY